MSNRTSIPRYLAIDSAQSSQAFGADEERMRELARTIEAEIMPRLLMSVAPSRTADEALTGSNFGAEPDTTWLSSRASCSSTMVPWPARLCRSCMNAAHRRMVFVSKCLRPLAGGWENCGNKTPAILLN